MEDTSTLNPAPVSSASHAQYQHYRHTAFNSLRPVTTKLLQLRNQPEPLQCQLVELQQLLTTLPPAGVAACWDYVAFPLFILLDSVLPARQSAKQSPATQGSGDILVPAAGGVADVIAPACSSDRVVEALLGTIEALLECSPSQGASGYASESLPHTPDDSVQDAVSTADRHLSLLQRLAPLLQLPREAASEEVHVKLQRCLAAGLRPLTRGTAADGAASAGEGAAGALVAYQRGGDSGTGTGGAGAGVGAGAAPLCSEDALPLAGFLLHSCLEAAEREVLEMQRGSKALCAAALTSLGLLLTSLPDPDTLGFFMPGVISGLSKHLYAAGAAASRTGPSLPPGSAATVQALTCLRDVVIGVLADAHTAPILGSVPFTGSQNTDISTGSSPSAPGPAGTPSNLRADDALSMLKELSAPSTTSGPLGNSGSGSSNPVGAAPVPAPGAKAPGAPQPRRRLRVERTLAWLEETSARMNSLLGRALPPLCVHSRPAVREQLAVTCAALLDHCGRALAPCQPLLLRLLFTLAQDEWRKVAEPSLDWVARRAAVNNPVAAGGSAGDGARDANTVAPSADGESGTDPLESASGDAGVPRPEPDQSALEDEFERFMQGLMSDSALLEPPALELDEQQLYGGLDEGAGGRDQGVVGDLGTQPGVGRRRQTTGQSPSTRPNAARSWTCVRTGVAEPPRTIETPPAQSPTVPQPLPLLPGLRQLVLEDAAAGHLFRAVRVGEAETVIQARCLTTALLVAGPSCVAEWLLQRPVALTDLLSGFFRCFAFDHNAAPLILYIRGEAGVHAPVVTPASRSVDAPTAAAPAATASPAPAAAATPSLIVAAATAAAAMAGGTAAAVELPRMPLGLLHLASQRSYGAVAAVARSLGWLARSADVQATAAVASGGRCTVIRGSNFRRLMDELVVALRTVVQHGAASSRKGVVGAVESGRGALADEGEVSGEMEPQELQPGRGAGSGLGEPSWQCEAAAVVTVMAEAVIGASNAWTPPVGSSSSGSSSPSASAPFPAMDPSYEAVLLALLQELVRPAIFKLDTHNPSSSTQGCGDGGATSSLTYDDVVRPELNVPRRPLAAQTLGENVMLLRVVLEAVGTAARATGPRFAVHGRLLRTVLVPLLELLGDPSPSVAASADTALQSICVHCGYGGSLKALVGANADYVVDALCARLRDLQRHPRAPHLLAALLRRAGVAPQFLPIMAEPLQRALQGLSILARHWSPQYTHPYLASLRELASGAGAEAGAAAAESGKEIAELNRLALEARNREEERLSAAEAAAGSTGGSTEAAINHSEAHEEVKRYFLKHAAAKGADGSAEGEAAEGAAEGAGADRRPLLKLSAAQLEDCELRFRRLHAAAVVAGAAADAATPLLLSSDLRSAIAASDVLRGALGALAATTPAVEAEAAVVEEYGGLETRMRPVRPETPRVLPAVAAVWSPLMAVLRDARTPLVERGVAAVAELVAVAGGKFLARRFQQEAWPVLQKLLTDGTAHTPGLLSLGTDAGRSAPQRLSLTVGSGDDTRVSGGEDAAGRLAPAAVTRVRVAALGCLEAVCSCTDAMAAVRTLTWAMAQAALPFLGASHSAPLHEAAQATLQAVSKLDPDGVWLLLYDTVHNMPASMTTLPSAAAAARVPPTRAAQATQAVGAQQRPPQEHDRGTRLPVERNPQPPGPTFLPLRVLLPPLPSGRPGQLGGSAKLALITSQQWPVTMGLAVDCGPRAQGLLEAVAKGDVSWHHMPILSTGEVAH